MNMDKVILCGTVCETPTLRYTKNNDPVTNIVVKTVKSWISPNGERKSNRKYHRVVVWGKMAENIVKYITRGKTVLIDGELSYHDHVIKQLIDGVEKETKINTTEIKAINIQVIRDYTKQESDE